MSQSSPHGSAQFGRQTSSAYWSSHQGSAQTYASDMSRALDGSSNIWLYPSDAPWTDNSGLHGSTAWDISWQPESFIAPGFDSNNHSNGGFEYGRADMENLAANDSLGYDQLPMASSESNGLPSAFNMRTLDLESGNTHSPQSYPSSDFFDSDMSMSVFSPDTLSGPQTPIDQWNYQPASISTHEELSPQISLAMSHMAAQNPQGCTPLDHSGFPKVTSSYAAYPASSAVGNGSSNDFTMASNSSRSHNSGSTSASWYLPGYSHDASGQTSMADQPLRGGTLRNMQTTVTLRPRHRCSIAPAPDKVRAFPETFDSGVTASQRKLNDKILVQGKHDGLTYKQIREQMQGEKPAESTLRGRYRSLTKPKKDRVRKPVWKKHDVELLNKFVEQELKRVETTVTNPQTLDLERKLAKIAWKRASDFIFTHGGSYHFGNATCKKKWMGLHPSP